METEPSRELDREVAEWIMGLICRDEEVPHYTSDVELALCVAEKVDGQLTIRRDPGGRWFAELRQVKRDSVGIYTANGRSLSAVICGAALAAVARQRSARTLSSP